MRTRPSGDFILTQKDPNLNRKEFQIPGRQKTMNSASNQRDNETGVLGRRRRQKKMREDVSPKWARSRKNVRLSSFGSSMIEQKPGTMSAPWSVSGVSPISANASRVDRGRDKFIIGKTFSRWENHDGTPSVITPSTNSDTKFQARNVTSRLPGGGWESPGPAHPPPANRKRRNKKNSPGKEMRVSRLSRPKPALSLTWDDASVTDSTKSIKQANFSTVPVRIALRRQQVEWDTPPAPPTSFLENEQHEKSRSSKSKASAQTTETNGQDSVRGFSISVCEQLDTEAADFAELRQFREKIRDFRKEKALLVSQIANLKDELNAAKDRIFELEALNLSNEKNVENARKEGEQAASRRIMAQNAKLQKREKEIMLLREQVQELNISLSSAVAQKTSQSEAVTMSHPEYYKKLEGVRNENAKLRKMNEKLRMDFNKEREQLEAKLRSMQHRLSNQKAPSDTMVVPSLRELGIKTLSLEERLQDVLNNETDHRHQFSLRDGLMGTVSRIDNGMYGNQKASNSLRYRGNHSYESKYDPSSRTLTPRRDHRLFSGHGSRSSMAGVV